eukprot:scaffold1702_cov27-Tisochrysis_lutea.AAC.2
MGDRDAFEIFDQDQDGVVSAKELKTMMQRLNFPVDDREVRDIIIEAGSLSTNSITQVRPAVQGHGPLSPRAPAAGELDNSLRPFLLWWPTHLPPLVRSARVGRRAGHGQMPN